MTPTRYQKIYDWFTVRPFAKQLLLALDSVLPLAVAAVYAELLLRYGFAWYYAAAFGADAVRTAAACTDFWQAVGVPAGTLLLGTLVRARINAPRPYAQPDFTPLKAKEGEGNALPSRHALSAGVVASAWLCTAPAGAVLPLVLMAAVCATRVLVGVHSIKDVAVGTAFGLVCGLLILL